MSGLSRAQKEEYQSLIQRHMAEKGVTRCNKHAPATGAIRFNFASRAQREAEEAKASQEMDKVRNA